MERTDSSERLRAEPDEVCAGLAGKQALSRSPLRPAACASGFHHQTNRLFDKLPDRG
jgi:hypothetical protein